MAVSLKHTTQAVGVEAGDGEIGKNAWNEEHSLTLGTGKLLGRSTAGTGAAEEITVGSGLTLSAGTLTAAGTVGGSNTQVQFNDSSAFGGDAGLTYNKTTNALTIGAGSLNFTGGTSGTVTIQPAAAAGTYTLTLPTDDGNANQVLTTDGSGVLSWTTPTSGGTPGGSNTQLQYNSSGAFAGASGLTTDGTSLTITGGSFTMTGNISASAWTTSGLRYKNVSATLTDTTSSGTVAAAYTNVYGGNTIAASNAATFTDYFTTHITEPTAGTNVTFTNKWALGLSGSLRVNGNITVASGNPIKFNGSASGVVTVQPASAAGTYTLTLPTSAGSASQVLTTDGSGVLSWSTPSGGSGTKTYCVFTPLDNQPTATNFATLDTRNSVATLDFDDTTQEEAVFVGIIPQGATLTSGIKVRIFWAATSATSGNVRWGAQFEKYGTDIDSDSFDSATEAHTATSGTSGIVVVTEITCTTIDSLAAGDQYRIKIYRDASDTTNDTVTGDAELIAVELQQVA